MFSQRARDQNRKGKRKRKEKPYTERYCKANNKDNRGIRTKMKKEIAFERGTSEKKSGAEKAETKKREIKVPSVIAPTRVERT